MHRVTVQIAAILSCLAIAIGPSVGADGIEVAVMGGRVTFEVPSTWTEDVRFENAEHGKIVYQIPNPDEFGAVFGTMANIRFGVAPPDLSLMRISNAAVSLQPLFDQCLVTKDESVDDHWRNVMAVGLADQSYLVLQRIGLEHSVVFEISLIVPATPPEGERGDIDVVTEILDGFNLLSDSVEIHPSR